MAVFMNSSKVLARIDDIINQAKKYLYIVSPYINLSYDVERLMFLEKASKRGVKITIVYRLDNDKTYSELQQLFDFPNVKIIGCPELHAKIYANEYEAILSSKNLTTRIETCSIEVGVLFKNNEPIYDDLIKTAKNIADIKNAIEMLDNTDNESETDNHGYCIRCGKPIKLNLLNPMCPGCYRIWAQFADPSYVETFCHYCGKKAYDITFEYPMEFECYQKYMTSKKWYS